MYTLLLLADFFLSPFLMPELGKFYEIKEVESRIASYT